MVRFFKFNPIREIWAQIQQNTKKFLEKNSLFVISESKVTFKNCHAVITLNQISNSRLIKNREFTANIIVLVF